jgi:nitrogen fixation NifU-like protein
MSAVQDDLRDLYQELILDHGRNPRNRRAMTDANHEALGHNPMCGDKFMIYVKQDENGLINDVSFEGQGCAISTASASMMTAIVKGKDAAQAKTLFDYVHTLCTCDDAQAAPKLDGDDQDRLMALSGVRQFPMRVKCATLSWHALNAALNAPAHVKPTVSNDDGGSA